MEKKNTFYSNCQRRPSSKKRVCFSVAEGEPANDTIAATGSDSSPDTSLVTGHYHTHKDNTPSLNGGGGGYSKKAKKKKEKRGGEEKDIKEPNENR